MDIAQLFQHLQQLHQAQQQQSNAQPDMQPNMSRPSMLPQQTQGQQSPVGGMMSNALSNAYTGGVAQATGLPWLAGGSSGAATSALLSLLLG